jgi:malate dehydrogenase
LNPGWRFACHLKLKACVAHKVSTYDHCFYIMNIAIVGATGSCGRQVAAQLLERGILAEDLTLNLVGHESGAHRNELWGLRADLNDAFFDRASAIEISFNVAHTDADLVVMMAGATLTKETKDRAALAETNKRIFTEVAHEVSKLSPSVIVIVQSNPVELAVHSFAGTIARNQVLGAGAWSDSLRFRRELARDLGVHRSMIDADVLGQHGDHMVPIWSNVRARGVSKQQLADVIGATRRDRLLSDLPEEISEVRKAVLSLVNEYKVEEAFNLIQRQPADIRSAVKPFFTHFTAGRTTELATAHAVVDLVEVVANGYKRVCPAQVMLEGELGGLQGPIAVPILIGQNGWSVVGGLDLADDEKNALFAAQEAINTAINSK